MNCQWLFRYGLLGLLLVFVWASPPTVAAQDTTDPTSIVQQQPSFFIRADVNKASRTYQEGETLRVNVLSEREAYVYVLYQQADGKVFQIFPNNHQPENKVAAKTRIEFPAADDDFRWQVSGPFGKEAIKVIASTAPIDPLHAPEVKQQRFNRLSPERLKDLTGTMQQAEPAIWAEDLVEITTIDKRGKLPAEPPKRVGLFVGAGKYRYNAEAKEAAGGKWEPDLPGPHHGARTLAKFLRDFGRLDEAKVLVNEEATKPKIEEAITKWLPSVTKPGDTVIIFHGGHGGQLPDDNGDEPDGQDEYLLTHDYLDMGIINVLLEKKKQGTLPDAHLADLAKVAPVIKGARNLDEVHNRLTRFTCITDDLFGHWLQRLAGRQVLVILDICHAAGFANKEKSLTPSADNPTGFHFLVRKSARLKDIGQADQALLAACSAAQVSYAVRMRDETLAKIQKEKGALEEWAKDDLAVLTYFVCDSVVNAPGPLKLEDAFSQIHKGMKAYFVILDPIGKKYKWDPPLVPHAPLLFNNCTKPVYLKP